MQPLAMKSGLCEAGRMPRQRNAAANVYLTPFSPKSIYFNLFSYLVPALQSSLSLSFDPRHCNQLSRLNFSLLQCYSWSRVPVLYRSVEQGLQHHLVLGTLNIFENSFIRLYPNPAL